MSALRSTLKGHHSGGCPFAICIGYAVGMPPELFLRRLKSRFPVELHPLATRLAAIADRNAAEQHLTERLLTWLWGRIQH